MDLSTLAAQADLPHADFDCAINGLCLDSRQAKPNFLFAALKGEAVDGALYIKDAIQNGATALLLETNARTPQDIPHTIAIIRAAEPRRALAKMAAHFYTPQPKMIAAITGTSGKTSTAHFARLLWQLCGHQSASMGTLGIVGRDFENYGTLTTPDSISLNRDLQMLAGKGISHVALEASSHGLDQFRLDGIAVVHAAFTNLSRDHLDYHKTFENYLAAKTRLFTDVMDKNGSAILNADAPECATLVAACKARGVAIMGFGHRPCELHILAHHFSNGGQDIQIAFGGTTYESRINLVGDFQLANVMAAAGLVLASGEKAEKVFAMLPQLQSVRGRLESVGQHNGATVYVDYAHKPDALKNVLESLRPHTHGRLIVVFGCGGDRDAGKRPIMGQIASTLADITIVTDDNPRSENPALIRQAIMAAAVTATEIGDRTEAIAHGLGLLQAGDALVIAGKGHESGQIIGKQTIPFDDAEVVRRLMQEKAA